MLVVVAALAFAPAALADDCPGQSPLQHPFAAWGDDGDYFLAPGGDFDASSSWTLANGASVDAGLSPSGKSLVLPPGASALSPAICVADGYTHARMMGSAIGAAAARVDVDVIYKGPVEDREMRVRMPDAWDPTRQFMLGQRDFVLDPTTGLGRIQLRFTSSASGTAVLDDVYVDPTARH
jgi:hypothetical protein